MDRALVVMARYPEVGRVKTRLAARLGAPAACALYRAFVDDLRARFAAAEFELVWAFTPDDADFAAVVGAGATLLAQGEGTLGARMERVFARLLTPGRGARFARVVMIGADVPHVPAAYLERAFAGLDEADLVLGPADDGGYYLVGLRAAHDVFSGVPMGTEHVYAATRARAAALGLAVMELPVLFDIDREEDLRRLPEHLREHPEVRLLHTMAVLRRGEESGWKSC